MWVAVLFPFVFSIACSEGDSITIEVAILGKGTVTSQPSGIDCVGNGALLECKPQTFTRSAIDVVAVSDKGSPFSGWIVVPNNKQEPFVKKGSLVSLDSDLANGKPLKVVAFFGFDPDLGVVGGNGLDTGGNAGQSGNAGSGGGGRGTGGAGGEGGSIDRGGTPTRPTADATTAVAPRASFTLEGGFNGVRSVNFLIVSSYTDTTMVLAYQNRSGISVDTNFTITTTLPGKVETNSPMPARVAIEFLRETSRSAPLASEGRWNTNAATCQIVLNSAVPAASAGMKGLNVQGTLTCADSIPVDPGFTTSRTSTAVRFASPVAFQGFVSGPSALARKI